MDRQKGKAESPMYIWLNLLFELNHKSKLNPKSRTCIFIGYGTDEYGYHFWDPENRKIFKDVVFNEQKMYKDLQTEKSTSENDLGVTPGSTPGRRVLRTQNSSNLKML